jgi:hypothetical protein
LVLSGLLAEDQERVRAGFEPCLNLIRARVKGEWASLAYAGAEES